VELQEQPEESSVSLRQYPVTAVSSEMEKAVMLAVREEEVAGRVKEEMVGGVVSGLSEQDTLTLVTLAELTVPLPFVTVQV